MLLADAAQKNFQPIGTHCERCKYVCLQRQNNAIGWANKFPLKANVKFLHCKKCMVTDLRDNRISLYCGTKKRVDIVPTSLALAQSGLGLVWDITICQRGQCTLWSMVFQKDVEYDQKSDSAKGYAAERDTMDATIGYVRNLNTQNAYSAFRDLKPRLHTWHSIKQQQACSNTNNTQFWK